MEQNLRCVIVDNDRPLVEKLYDMCVDIPQVEVVNSFLDPGAFLEAAPRLDFNTCLLDTYLPGTTGLAVAKKIPDKSIIFITGEDAMLRHALAYSPVSVITKPVTKTHLTEALLRAYALNYYKSHRAKEYKLFSVAYAKGSRKVNIHAPDISYVCMEAGSGRDKHIYLKNGDDYILTGCSFEELLSFSPMLVQVNKTELISVENVHIVENDMILLRGNLKSHCNKPIVISRAYKKEFFNRL